MKAVSDAYKAGMKQPLRETSYVKISLENIDPTAKDDGEYWWGNATDYSEVDTLDYPYEYGSTVATLELNRWLLGSASQVIEPSTTINDGFVCDDMSDENGEFFDQPNFGKDFYDSHVMPGITLTFDTRTGEYPLEAIVEFFDWEEGYEQVVIHPRGVKEVVYTSLEYVAFVSITFTKMLPYRRPRIESIVWGVERVFGNDEIAELTQTHDVDPLSRRLPSEKFKFTLIDFDREYDPDNPNGLSRIVSVHSPVKISHGYVLPDGTTEWLKADEYTLDNKPSFKNNRVTFSAIGLLGSLQGTYYKSEVGEKTFYDMAVAVLQDANLTPTAQGGNPWDVDSSLQSMTTTAVLPIDTHANCLQLIAHACRCRLYTDDDNIIHIKPFGVTKTGIYEGEFSDNGHTWYSEWSTVDKGNNQGNTYVTLEFNRWLLGGDNQIIVEDEPSGRGYVCEAVSDSNGDFSTAPVFTRTFDVSHDLRVMTVQFDTITGDHPTSATVRYYNDNDVLISTKTVDITSEEVTIRNDAAIGVSKFEMTLNGGLPYRRVRVTKIYYRDTDFTLNFDTIKDKSQALKTLDVLKSVSIEKTVYMAEEGTSDIFRTVTTQNTLHIEFGSVYDSVAVSVTGGTLRSNSKIYGRAADLYFTSGTKTITVTGTKLSESTVTKSYYVADDGEVDEEKNPLITTDAMCDALAAHVKAYLTMRNTYDADYRGNPEVETGDIIGLQTPYTDEMDALVLVDEIKFNGSLSGKLKVKALI